MSRPWQVREYVSSDWLDNWIERELTRINGRMGDEDVQSSELYKIMLLAKIEVLDDLSRFIREECENLGTILKLFGVETVGENDMV